MVRGELQGHEIRLRCLKIISLYTLSRFPRCLARSLALLPAFGPGDNSAALTLQPLNLVHVGLDIVNGQVRVHLVGSGNHLLKFSLGPQAFTCPLVSGSNQLGAVRIVGKGVKVVDLLRRVATPVEGFPRCPFLRAQTLEGVVRDPLDNLIAGLKGLKVVELEELRCSLQTRSSRRHLVPDGFTLSKTGFSLDLFGSYNTRGFLVLQSLQVEAQDVVLILGETRSHVAQVLQRSVHVGGLLRVNHELGFFRRRAQLPATARRVCPPRLHVLGRSRLLLHRVNRQPSLTRGVLQDAEGRTLPRSSHVKEDLALDRLVLHSCKGALGSRVHKALHLRRTRCRGASSSSLHPVEVTLNLVENGTSRVGGEGTTVLPCSFNVAILLSNKKLRFG